ncbi:four helix bundle protein [candidate division WOR_3 bacterium SM23_60]|uniref:Four helix bundle protein n=1 Tax=candidate division WOR_3 bacterium SM23_60 TaxID=1703780 RepID=A0A0S8GJ56_UNCW3|nr:MAG: four helix bundle protein [candidate division WOR_3 bacterium SM23_60]
MNDKKRITSYHDLEVYQNTYNACLEVMKHIVPRLPERKKYDLVQQLSRSSKAIPRLIAEGYAKRHQKSGFQKYLEDTMAECNETAVGLCQTKDIYGKCVDLALYNTLIDLHDKSVRQIYNVASAWRKFRKNGKSDADK